MQQSRCSNGNVQMMSCMQLQWYCIYIVCDSSCVGLSIVQWILSRITAWSLMIGTPIDQVRIPINQGLIKDLVLPLLSVDL